MPEPVKGNGRYMAGLDGLRALAVFGVIAYHLNLSFAPGGLLGVDVFFVLSGYLITDLLVYEWQSTGQIRFKNFWLRRARRLLPALFIMIIVVVDYVMLHDPSQLVALRSDVVASIVYVSNRWFIFHKVSYFASFGPPSPLGHLWSLAVEEQFYLLWPLLLWCGLRYIPRRGLPGLILAGAAASALWMAVLYHPGSDPSRVYYGTDTRAFALLIGAALALVWPSRKLSTAISPLARIGIDLAGCAGLFVVLFLIWRTNQYQTFLYQGGMLLCSVASAVLVAALAHPASRLGKAMGWEPLRWLGERSYGIYLWCYPVIVLTTPVVDMGLNVGRVILQTALIIALAALSWHFVEDPIRHGALQKLWALLHSKQSSILKTTWIATAVAGLAFSAFCVGMVGTLPNAGADSAIATSAASDISSSVGATPLTTDGVASASLSGSAPATGPTQAQTGSASASDNEEIDTSTTDTSGATGPHATSGKGVTAIGDSVMVDIAPDLSRLLPGIVIDGKVGRQLIYAQPVVKQLQDEGKLGNLVIIELGTNGPFTSDQLVALLDSLGPVQQVILVNTRVPRPWQNVVNTTLVQVAASRPNTTLVDWYAASDGHRSFFSPDGVHLEPAGSWFYASLVAKAVQP